MPKYKITAVCMIGVTIAGFMISGNDKEVLLRYEEVIKLCKSGEVENGKAVICNGKYHVKITDDTNKIISGIKNDKYEIVKHSSNSDSKQWFIKSIKDDSIKSVDDSELWMLAINDCILGAEGFIMDNGEGLSKALKVYEAEKINA